MILDDDDDDDREIGDRQWCECGNPKTTDDAEQCVQCLFLDGTRAQAMLISMLRTRGTATLGEISDALYRTDNGRRPAIRMLRTMIKAGRIASREEEIAMESKNSIAGHTGVTRLVYFLTAPARGELKRAA